MNTGDPALPANGTALGVTMAGPVGTLADSEDVVMEERDGEEGEAGDPEDDNGEEDEEEVDDKKTAAIRDDLSAALKISGDSGGAYSFSKPYTDAPNPALKLADLGTVGLPLSTRDAEALKSRCAQAPFGKGERTLVDTSVRDTWEMDGGLVSFENPNWTQFIGRVAREVCLTLGVNFEASHPRCELYKLLLYETGSHFLPHVDTEKAKGMFATIIIVLPSKFTGGAAHLSHGALSSVYDCSATSHFQTTAMAWYTDVTHEIKPITSGYRLALSYNLIHTTHTLRPALSSNDKTVAELYRIMTLWNKAETCDSAPEKLVYLLDHQYSQANLHAGALKGTDAHRVAILDILVKQLGFGMGLASVCCHLTGPCDDYGESWGRYRDRYESPREYNMVDVEERDMSIENFVDMEGNDISDELDIDEETETIPGNLAEIVEDGPCDDEEYEGYQGNAAGMLEQWYRRTVLVIWPSWKNYDILYQGTNGFLRACKHIAGLDSSPPSLADTALALFVVRASKSNGKLAAEAVCRKALDWNDAILWCRAVDHCSNAVGVNVLLDDRKYAAIRLFGWSRLVPSFDKMVQLDAHNVTRMNFLKRFQAWVDAPQSPPLPATTITDIRTWIATRTAEVMIQLKKPETSECPALLEVVHAQGGLTFLRERMLPQLLVVADGEFLQEFAKQVHADKKLPDSNEKKATLATLLTSAASKTTFYKVNTIGMQRTGYPYYSLNSYQRPTSDQFVLTKAFVQLCIDLDCISAVGSVIERIMDNTGRSSADIRDCAKFLMLHLVGYFSEQAKAHPDLLRVPRFKELQTTAIDTYMNELPLTLRSHGTLSKTDVTTLLDAAIVGSDPDVFVKSVAPKLETMKFGAIGFRALVEGLRAKQAQIVVPADYKGRSLDSILLSFGKKSLETNSLVNGASIVNTLEWCSSVGMPSLQEVVFSDMISSLVSTQRVSVLASAISDLRQWGDKVGRTETLAPVFQKILQTWADNVLGPLPASNAALAAELSALTKWSANCACMHCSKVVTFISKSSQRSDSYYRIGAPARKHLEGKINMFARTLVTYTMISGSPQGLTVTKSPALFQIITWRANQAQGVTYVKALGNTDAEIQRRLGVHYNRIMLALRGGLTAQNAAAQAPPPAKRQRT